MHSQSAMPPADAASTVIDVLSGRMQELPARGQDDARDAGLLVYLGRVPDRRRVRGRRHQLTAILALACGAVTAGAKSLTAIAEWAAAAVNGHWEIRLGGLVFSGLAATSFPGWWPRVLPAGGG